MNKSTLMLLIKHFDSEAQHNNVLSKMIGSQSDGDDIDKRRELDYESAYKDGAAMAYSSIVNTLKIILGDMNE